MFNIIQEVENNVTHTPHGPPNENNTLYNKVHMSGTLNNIIILLFNNIKYKQCNKTNE